MAHSPRTVYELMNWAAEMHDLDPSQRKVLYQKLETEGTLKRSKDPMKDASKYAKDLKRQAETLKKRSRKTAGKLDKSAVKSGRKKGDDIEDLHEEFESDDAAADPGQWYDDDVEREDYPDLYESDY
jgi:hypothetical protein